MDSRELRIGNYLFDRENRLCKVEEISAKLENDVYAEQFRAPAIKGCLTSLPHKPIPITEERLVNCGFESLPFVNLLNSYNKNIGRNRIISVSCVGTPNEMVWLCEINATNPKQIDDLVCIKNYDYDGKTHLHELQNIIYDFSKEELTIKFDEVNN